MPPEAVDQVDLPEPVRKAQERVKAREEEAKRLADAEAGKETPAPTTDAGASTVSDPAQTPEPQPAPKDDEVDALRAQIKELKKKLNDADGARGGQLDQLRQQNEQLANLNHQLSERMSALENGSPKQDPNAAAKPPDSTHASGEWTDDDTFSLGGPDILDLIDRRIRIVSGGTIAKVRQDFEPLQKEVSTVRQHIELDSFTAAVERMAPGFAAANGNDPDWMEFLTSPKDADLDPNETWQDWYNVKPTPEWAAAAFKAFTKGTTAAPGKTTAPGAPAPTPGTPKVRSAAEQADAAPAAGTSATDGTKPVLKRADFEAFKLAMRDPQANATQAQYEKNTAKLAEFHLAEAEGRLL